VLPELTALAPAARIVVLSNYPRWRMSDIVRRRGAIGYVEKRVPPRRLVREILIAAALTERLMTSVSAQFSGESSSPRRARTFVRGVLDSADELLLETVELLVSELVTNAVVHASSAPVVDVHVSPETLRIEVYDASATLPRPRAADGGGRGDEVSTSSIAAPRGGAPTAPATGRSCGSSSIASTVPGDVPRSHVDRSVITAVSRRRRPDAKEAQVTPRVVILIGRLRL
jgi:hypothetical protein